MDINKARTQITRTLLAELSRKDKSLTVFVSRYDRRRLEDFSSLLQVTMSEVIRRSLAQGLDQLELELHGSGTPNR